MAMSDRDYDVHVAAVTVAVRSIPGLSEEDQLRVAFGAASRVACSVEGFRLEHINDATMAFRLHLMLEWAEGQMEEALSARSKSAEPSSNSVDNLPQV